ncbi:MAG: CBS domain-containing protein [Chloroflexi bacterium]|nr:CBS domain-containing protein [Chloroflexota bacterium]
MPTRADSPAHRLELSFPLLSTLGVRDAMTAPRLLVGPAERIADVRQRLHDAGLKRAAVIRDERLVGVISLTDIARVSPNGQLVSEVMTADPLTVAECETLDVALSRLSERRVSWLPVIDDDDSGRLIGEIEMQSIMRRYRAQAARGVHDMREMVS